MADNVLKPRLLGRGDTAPMVLPALDAPRAVTTFSLPTRAFVQGRGVCPAVTPAPGSPRARLACQLTLSTDLRIRRIESA
jgi:hypothetical protein